MFFKNFLKTVLQEFWKIQIVQNIRKLKGERANYIF